jgi:hypothetical protein
MPDVASLALGAAIGSGATVAIWALLRWRHAVPGRNAGPPPRDRPALGGSEEGADARLDERTATSVAVPPAGPDPPTEGPSDAGVLVGTSELASPAPPAPPEEYVFLSKRVVVHLGALGRLGLDELARPERTQQGMIAALACPQSTLSRVLARLVASDVLTRERRHVRGLDRRVYVYALTSRGESLARELRLRPGSPASAVPSPVRAPAREPWPAVPR